MPIIVNEQASVVEVQPDQLPSHTRTRISAERILFLLTTA